MTYVKELRTKLTYTLKRETITREELVKVFGEAKVFQMEQEVKKSYVGCGILEQAYPTLYGTCPEWYGIMY